MGKSSGGRRAFVRKANRKLNMEIVPFDPANGMLDWHHLIRALEQGHRLPKAEIGDTFLYRGDDTMLSRSAWIDGLGIAVKTATIFPGNVRLGKPTTGGGLCLYSDDTGSLEAIVDFSLVTNWKTAGDSLLAASKLARPDASRILIVGAGTVAQTLPSAYGVLFPDASFSVWNRTREGAERLASQWPGMEVVDDLAKAVQSADIISAATMSSEPVIKGEWLRAGQHIDLIGAYRPDMREADDTALRRSSIFVDSRSTTLEHIGELMIPLGSGSITQDDIRGDFYDIAGGQFTRRNADEITLFKNGGGAHLDLMTARYVLACWRGR